jgi:predicted dehydrogenase
MRFGLVGTGFWAADTHAPALSTHPDVELAGVWGRSRAKAESLARGHSAQVYEDLETMFEDVDAVAFAVPPNVQAVLAVRAAAHGCHLLLDKPVALTTDGADAVVDAVAAAGVRSIVFFTSRFVPNVEEWLATTAPSDDWQSARIRMWGSIFEPGNPFGESPWRRDRGALWDIGPHALSIMLPMLGPVVDVAAIPGRGDAVEVLLRHGSGSASSLSLSLTAQAGSKGDKSIFYGAKRSSRPPEPTSTPLEAMGNCITQLITDQPEGWTHPSNAVFGRDIVRILESAERFMQSVIDAPPAADS